MRCCSIRWKMCIYRIDLKTNQCKWNNKQGQIVWMQMRQITAPFNLCGPHRPRWQESPPASFAASLEAKCATSGGRRGVLTFELWLWFQPCIAALKPIQQTVCIFEQDPTCALRFLYAGNPWVVHNPHIFLSRIHKRRHSQGSAGTKEALMHARSINRRNLINFNVFLREAFVSQRNLHSACQWDTTWKSPGYQGAKRNNDQKQIEIYHFKMTTSSFLDTF